MSDPVARYQPGLNDLNVLIDAGLVADTDRITVLVDNGTTHSGDGNVHCADCSHTRNANLPTTPTRLDVSALVDRLREGRYRLCGCTQIADRIDDPSDALDITRPQVLLSAAEMQMMYWLGDSSPERAAAERHDFVEDTVQFAHTHLARYRVRVEGRLGVLVENRCAALSATVRKARRNEVYQVRRQRRVLDGAAAWSEMRSSPPPGMDRNRDELLEMTAHLDIGVDATALAGRDGFTDTERRSVYERVCAAEVWVYAVHVPVVERSPLAWASELVQPTEPGQRALVRLPAAMVFALEDFSWPTPICLDDGYPGDLVYDAIRLSGPGRPPGRVAAALAVART